MVSVDVQFHTFLISTPETVERTKANRKDLVELQLYTFLTSTPDNV